jgi:hypothetical protein
VHAQTPVRLSWTRVALLVGDYAGACPRRYAYRYVAGLPAPSTSALVAGTAYDHGLRALFEARRLGETETSALAAAHQHAEETLTARWAETGEPDDRLTETLALVREAVAHFAAKRPGLVPAALQSEHRFTVRVGDEVVTVVGWSDRIDADGTLVEHKWSGSPRWRHGAEGQEWEAEWAASARDQLTLYWLARRAEAARGLPQPAPVVPRGRVEVLFQRRGLTEPQLRCLELTFGPEDEARVLQAVANAWAVIRAGRFPARPGPACRWCPYQERCRGDEEARGTPFAALTEGAA